MLCVYYIYDHSLTQENARAGEGVGLSAQA